MWPKFSVSIKGKKCSPVVQNTGYMAGGNQKSKKIWVNVSYYQSAGAEYTIKKAINDKLSRENLYFFHHKAFL